MKFELKTILPVIISLMVALMLYQFRTVPVSQFWKGFRILYVYSDFLSEQDILTVLEKNGCDSVVCAARQRVPVVSPIAPMQEQTADSYLVRRNAFFTDKNHRATVFYVPESEGSSLERAIRELSAFQGTSAGTDGKSSFPWVAPLICCAFFLLLLLFSSQKLLYLCGTALFLLLSFCRPLYTVGSAVCLYLLAFFLFHRLWKRKEFFRTALNSPYILLFALSPILVLLFTSPLVSLFYGSALLGSFCLVWLYHVAERARDERYYFKPVFIRSARMIPLVGKLGIRLIAALVLALALIFVGFTFLGSVSGFVGSVSMPSLPAPVARSDSELVQLSDFVDWTWNTVTFPYRKLGETARAVPREGETVAITDYVESNGKIVPVRTPAYMFNNEFRENVYKSIENFEYPAVEKLMLRQGRNTSFGYAKSASPSSSERFAVPLLFVFIAIPAALGINYIIGRKRYGLSI